jgi:hypothetical protein
MPTAEDEEAFHPRLNRDIQSAVVEALSPTFNSLTPLPYQREIVAYLKETEPELWKWACLAKHTLSLPDHRISWQTGNRLGTVLRFIC